MISNSSSGSRSGLSMRAMVPATISPRLWGAMFVAMPTAMPLAPLISRFGTRDGRTRGSLVVPSKFGVKSTVSLSMSVSRSSAMRVIRHSVYR